MLTLVTYDIKTPYIGEPKNKAVKGEMKALGYSDDFSLNDQDYFLPNTSLWKDGVTPEKAKQDLLTVAKENSATVERLFATEISNSVAIPGEPFK